MKHKFKKGNKVLLDVNKDWGEINMGGFIFTPFTISTISSIILCDEDARSTYGGKIYKTNYIVEINGIYYSVPQEFIIGKEV